MTGETVLLTPLEAADQDFMEQMTYEAAIGGLREQHAYGTVLGDEKIRTCFEDWGKPGDYGLLAVDERGIELGAAWRRIFPDKYLAIDQGRSFTPEVIMAVEAENRGRGIGGTLLNGLIGQAREAGIARLRLNVVARNTPALRLYGSRGFTTIDSSVTNIGTEAAYSWRMALWTDERQHTGASQECYTETDYERTGPTQKPAAGTAS